MLLRYALNMATEKKVLADFLGPGYVPARSLIAPLPQYPQPGSLKIEVDGRVYDVLSFDVEGARSLLAKAGFPGGIGHGGSRLEVPTTSPCCPKPGRKPKSCSSSGSSALNIRVKLVAREFNVHWRMVLEADYTRRGGLCGLAALSGPERVSGPVCQRFEWQPVRLV